VDGWITYSSSVRVLSCPQLFLYVITGASDTLTTVEEDRPTNRFNDAKCGPAGQAVGWYNGVRGGAGEIEPTHGITVLLHWRYFVA